MAFGSMCAPPFGSLSTPTFGSATSAAIGSATSAGFGSATKPAFGATNTPTFGSNSSPAFGSAGTAFVVPTVPEFGASGTPMFGSSRSSAFGTSSPAAFGASSTPAFGGSSNPSFSVGSTQTSGQSTSEFSTSPFVYFHAGSPSTASAFGSTGLGQSDFGCQRRGSRVISYNATTEVDGGTSGQFGKLKSVSAMPSYEDRSREKLRWEDYQVGDKGGPLPSGQSTGFGGSSSSTKLTNTSANPFSSSISSNPFAPKSSTFSIGFSTSASAFSSSGFGASTSATAPSIFAPSTSVLVANTYPSPGFGQSSSLFSSAPAQHTSPFSSDINFINTQSSQLFNSIAPTIAQTGSQKTAPAFGSTGVEQSAFGFQRRGSRVTKYIATTEADGGTSGQLGKLKSISAMPSYKDRSHEELRWEDNQLRDKGGPFAYPPAFSSSTAQTNTFAFPPVFGHLSANPFSISISSNPFTPKRSTLYNGFDTCASAFCSPGFGVSTPATTASILAPSTCTFVANSSPSPVFGHFPSLFSSSPAHGTSPFSSNINFNNTQSSQLFNSTAPTIVLTGSQSMPSAFRITDIGPSGFGGQQGGSRVVRYTGTIETGGVASGLIRKLESISAMSIYKDKFHEELRWEDYQLGDKGGPLPSGQSVCLGGFSSSTTQTNTFALPSSFGQLSANPLSTSFSYSFAPKSSSLSTGCGTSASAFSSSGFGASTSVIAPSIFAPSTCSGLKVPFFSEDEDTPTTAKADVLFIPGENPTALVTHPMEQWPARTSSENASSFMERCSPVNGNDASVENSLSKEQVQPNRMEPTSNVINEDCSFQKKDKYMTVSGHRAGEAAIVYEKGAEIEALMPKLQRSDYYTEPPIQELTAKERADPGFCSHVKDFVVGRHGYGSIKFLGETDVRRLDLESLIQFNNREVIVYMDDTKKPPVGQGLNKPAEVTLLNLKCFDKKTGQQYTEGPKIEKYKEMLKRQAMEQCAEFLSYDSTKGEWKIRVSHFNA